jgi:putative DNA-invertase from lambdoid prophage Rac
MPTAYGYIRFSTNKQGVISIESQKMIIQDLYDRHVDKVQFPVLEIFVDEHVSAREFEFLERPEGKRLAARARKGDIVLFAKLDRAFRDLRDSLNVMHFWDKSGIRVICPDFGFSALGLGPIYDSGTFIGKFGLVMIGLCAEIEGTRSSQRIKDFQAMAAREGRASSGSVPYGFCYVRRGKPTGPKDRPPAWIQPDDHEQSVMWFVYKSRKLGHTFYKIVEHLKAQKIRNRKGKDLGITHVQRFYRNAKILHALRKKLKEERGFDLREWEFLTLDGVICTRFDKEDLKPKQEGQ